MTNHILSSLIMVGSAVLIGLLGQSIGFRLMPRFWKASDKSASFQHAVLRWQSPLRVLLPALFVLFVLPLTSIPETLQGRCRHALIIVTIITFSWFLVRLIHSGREFILKRFNIDSEDNLAARRVYTQWRVVERILTVVVVFFAVASVLTTFDSVRNIGVSILASAGVLGIVLGLAAQRSLTTLLGGLQIAITQPIRLDDVVIVENEWGRVEEINLTYVVVRIWDQRRLVLPVTHFLEKPFQNWTRTSADILATVYIYTDYTMPVEALRAELKRIAEATELWDRRVCMLQVTDAKERTLELRALLSAVDSSTAWTLRCHVREALIHYLQQHHPDSLPRTRITMDSTDV